jgi:hypothetical protein
VDRFRDIVDSSDILSERSILKDNTHRVVGVHRCTLHPVLLYFRRNIRSHIDTNMFHPRCRLVCSCGWLLVLAIRLEEEGVRDGFYSPCITKCIRSCGTFHTFIPEQYLMTTDTLFVRSLRLLGTMKHTSHRKAKSVLVASVGDQNPVTTILTATLNSTLIFGLLRFHGMLCGWPRRVVRIEIKRIRNTAAS